ncbi:hypothetical protein CISG_02470 [Coccidioides immitis RMSCC 3703]|uniref:Uncharacterized protein n=1 Tax=Coccidioides immitis RMSCC 3703 TaxID=454286 RepID=A0A0J8U347_COCIT|nr:hypothetical protein CISG_02470 [Coccidioides immitis RMSCC 3703]
MADRSPSISTEGPWDKVFALIGQTHAMLHQKRNGSRTHRYTCWLES